ncbi:serine/threonine-protein kinase [Scrofimicrobium sp. R131]|uniref:non-specific serine/threonine protein kinase n=1 Tax=Scrofimicrobium appendicitidis TaxID=3079930 RepID=A0AAU7V703_9ACTO
MSAAENRTGRRLGGRYMLLTLIARGGMGEVWKARDTLTGALVAAKVLRPELTGEEVSLSRLRLEAKNAMRAKHPNIAAVLDSGEEDSQGWIIMELVEGQPLNEFMGDGLKLSPAELIPVLLQTAYALDAAARADVVHRDIKPANILVKADGRVKLTDFGVSLAQGQANLTAAGMVMGTAQYLPPEQALGKVATPAGDLYALGVIAFEALAGARPYTGDSQVDIAFAHVNEDIPPLPADVPVPLADLVTRLLSKDPDDRPNTGAALARELTRVAEEIGVGTAPVPLRVQQLPADTPLPTAPQGQPLPAAAQVPEPAGPSDRWLDFDLDPDGSPAAEAEPTVAPKVELSGPVAQAEAALASPAPSASSPSASSPSSNPPVPPVHHVRKQWLPVSPDAVPAASQRPRRPVAPSRAAAEGARASRSPAPTRSERPAADRTETGWGLWVIVGLTVLTVILIVVAMFRDHEVTGSEDTPAAAVTQQMQEVHTWLTPLPGV